MNFQTGVGCTYCNLTGYRGRAAIYELLEIDRRLADAIRRGDSMHFADLVRQREGYHDAGRCRARPRRGRHDQPRRGHERDQRPGRSEPVVPKIEAVSQTDVDALLERSAAR